MFVDELKSTLNEDFNVSVTENGAVGYRTTGKELLDINFAVSSMRSWSEEQIVEKFIKVYYEDKVLAVKWLFFARDVREGLGERRLFRVCMKYLAEQHPEVAKVVVGLIPEYGRYDDLWCLLDTSLAEEVVSLVKHQLMKDIEEVKEAGEVSLLAKWLPSVNASSVKTRKMARSLVEKLSLTERQYRKAVARLRAYLKVTEVSMSAGEWSKIEYSAVPSKANLRYSDAFLRHDKERREEYLERLQKGETKINASVAFPHDVVHKYCNRSRWRLAVDKFDTTLEEMWKALPDFVNGAGNTICVADGSASMITSVGGTEVTALEVANALAIYFAERSSGQFKDKYITFSQCPQMVDFSNANSLKEKLEIAKNYNECANTNVEAVFNLVLQTAINGGMRQEDLPQNILILSDMEFDRCAVCGNGAMLNSRLFSAIANKYAKYGYKLPRLIFWNICGRTETIPVRENELGVALVSGFSPVVARMVLGGKVDPLECLLEQLEAERYCKVGKALEGVV